MMRSPLAARSVAWLAGFAAGGDEGGVGAWARRSNAEARAIEERAIEASGFRLPGQSCDMGDGEVEARELTGKRRETFKGVQDCAVVGNRFQRIVMPLQTKVE